MGLITISTFKGFTLTSSQLSIPDLEQRARVLRATCVQMAFDGREGHLSSALSCLDVLIALYRRWLNLTPQTLEHPERDRFIFSKGHAATALYTVLADCGFIEPSLLETYAQTNSPLPNHPCVHALKAVETSSGSLGHGLGIATGMAYGMRLDGRDARVAVLMSDGECNEGSVWEAAMFAAAQKLDKVLAIVDNNGVQAVGRSDQLMGFTSLQAKFEAFGWAARTIDGNDMAQVVEALEAFPFAPDKPSAIIAKTVGGAGVSFMQDQVVWHYRCPPAEEVIAAFEELGARPLHKEGCS